MHHQTGFAQGTYLSRKWSLGPNLCLIFRMQSSRDTQSQRVYRLLGWSRGKMYYVKFSDLRYKFQILDLNVFLGVKIYMFM